MQAFCAHIASASAKVRSPIDGKTAALRITDLRRMFGILYRETRWSLGRGLMHGYEDEVVQCLQTARAVVPDEGEKAELAELLVMAYESRGTPRAQLPADLQQYCAQKFTQIGGAQNVLHELLDSARNLRACAAPGCGHRERGGERRLNRCASCGVFRYCSKECQRAHWKAVRKSHKEVCVALATLSALLDGPQDGFIAAYRATDDDDLAVVFDHLESPASSLNGRSTPERRRGACICDDARLLPSHTKASALKNSIRTLDGVQGLPTDDASVLAVLGIPPHRRRTAESSVSSTQPS